MDYILVDSGLNIFVAQKFRRILLLWYYSVFDRESDEQHLYFNIAVEMSL